MSVARNPINTLRTALAAAGLALDRYYEMTGRPILVKHGERETDVRTIVNNALEFAKVLVDEARTN